MKNRSNYRLLVVLAAVLLVFPSGLSAEEKVLMDFKEPGEVKNWSPTNLDELREAANKAFFEKLATTKGDKLSAYRPPQHPPAPEPPVKLELATEHATPGKHNLKLTYAGGKLPTVGTDKITVDDWSPYKTFQADVFASRACLVVFRVLREKSGRGDDWDGLIGRYEKVARLEPGKNEVVELTYANNKGEGLGSLGKVMRFEISMYAPKDGDSIWVSNLRLSTELPKATTLFSYLNVHFMGEVREEAPFFPKRDRKIKVLGTDWELSAVPEIGHRLEDQWAKPEKKSVEQIEAEFGKDYEELKKTNPRALLAIFRDGQKGYDPSAPEKVYSSWRNTELQGHDPGGVYAVQFGKHPGKSNLSTEFFLRRRTFLMKADLSSIPVRSKILAARLLVVKTSSPKTGDPRSDYGPIVRPAFFVAEACNRDWDEAVANGIEYAEGKFWKEICGEYWSGGDPDFFPLVIAYGQAGYDQNVFDFTEAVRYWTEGRHPNFGFTMYSFPPYMEYCTVWTRHVQDVKKRPALMVIYEPKEKEGQ